MKTNMADGLSDDYQNFYQYLVFLTERFGPEGGKAWQEWWSRPETVSRYPLNERLSTTDRRFLVTQFEWYAGLPPQKSAIFRCLFRLEDL